MSTLPRSLLRISTAASASLAILFALATMAVTQPTFHALLATMAKAEKRRDDPLKKLRPGSG